MSMFFWGFIFVLLSFNINIGSSTIDLLPDFVGFILLFKLVNTLSSKSENFVKIRPYIIGMIIFTSVMFIASLLGFTNSFAIPSMVLALLSIIVTLYITFTIIKGIADIETASQIDLATEKLLKSWQRMALFQIITPLLVFFMPLFLISAIVLLVLTILFLINCNKTCKLYANNLAS